LHQIYKKSKRNSLAGEEFYFPDTWTISMYEGCLENWSDLQQNIEKKIHFPLREISQCNRNTGALKRFARTIGLTMPERKEKQ
jgi:hypothetical protein